MSKEKCVICGDTTIFDYETHIDYRHFYVEGMGQLCKDCYESNGEFKLQVPKSLILSHPNDSELGQKVRELYHRRK